MDVSVELRIGGCENIELRPLKETCGIYKEVLKNMKSDIYILRRQQNPGNCVPSVCCTREGQIYNATYGSTAYKAQRISNMLPPLPFR